MSVHQLKVTVAGPSPVIWRRLQVRSSTCLAELHGVLRVAMGRTACHRYQFGPPQGLLAPRTTLAALLDVGAVLAYTCTDDTGGAWRHLIEVEKLFIGPRPGTTYPRCTGGQRDCPPDGPGGAVGYAAMLRARRGTHRGEAAGWGGGRSDPDVAFDPAEVNATLATLAAIDRTSAAVPTPCEPVARSPQR